MKKLVMATATAVCLLFTGCKSVPSVDTMTEVSTAIGYSAGLVANMTKIDDQSRNAVIDIMNIVVKCIPATNETFQEAWMPIAKEHVDVLIGTGKIDEGQGKIILSAFNTVVIGLDYIFEVRYPKAKEYKELVSAAVTGFSTGFLTVFKPANLALATNNGKMVDYDEDAFEYLSEKAGK